jgi:glycerol-3-phosphate acyltransferase PlsY
MIDALLIIIAYLLGSVSSAVIISGLLHLPDPRTQGSGNPGATNVLRIGGKKAAVLVLTADMLKGLIPVLIGKTFAPAPAVVAAVGLAAFLGHLYPVFFQFKGGKGVATALGVWLGISIPMGLLLLAVWLVTAIVFRTSSLAALVATVSAPLLSLWLSGAPAYSAMAVVMGALLIWRHKGNIRNLINGTEPKIGKKHRDPAGG